MSFHHILCFGLLLLLFEENTEPFEINLLLPLMGFIFCGLPLLTTGLIVWVFIKRIKNREDAFSRWVIEQEKQAGEEKNKTSR